MILMTTGKKTSQDPVEKEVLDKLQELTNSRNRLANQYVDLAHEQIRIQVAIREIDKEMSRLFEKELVDRGLDPNTGINIDPQTGMMALTESE